MSAPLMVQPRCPVCWAPTEGCGMNCDIARCDEPKCRVLYVVAEGHECAETCDVCGEDVNPDARCCHGFELCPEHLDDCRDCRNEAYDDRGVGSAIESWRDR